MMRRDVAVRLRAAVCVFGILLLIVFVVALARAMETRQVFIDADDDAGTGYPGDGSEFVLRHALDEQHQGASGWGRWVTVPCCVEYYNDQGELIVRYGGYCDLIICTADLDADGDVDLADYAMLRRDWTGPGGIANGE